MFEAQVVFAWCRVEAEPVVLYQLHVAFDLSGELHQRNDGGVVGQFDRDGSHGYLRFMRIQIGFGGVQWQSAPLVAGNC